MQTASELFENADWEFTSERSIANSTRKHKQPKSRVTPYVTFHKQNRVKNDGAVNVCGESQCFTGMVVALPLSLLAWAGIFSFIFLLIRYFKY